MVNDSVNHASAMKVQQNLWAQDSSELPGWWTNSRGRWVMHADSMGRGQGSSTFRTLPDLASYMSSLTDIDSYNKSILLIFIIEV